MQLKRIGAGVAAVLAIACAAPATAANFSIPDVLSYPFVVDLVSAPQANRIAWVRTVRGVRNVWVADGPTFTPRQVTAFTADDGEELTQLTFSPDGAVLSVADILCAYGVSTAWPEGASGFTTAEVKCNFTGTLREGEAVCTATLLHGGRTTQVWDARVEDAASGKLMAAFRCTQIILYPRA